MNRNYSSRTSCDFLLTTLGQTICHTQIVVLRLAAKPVQRRVILFWVSKFTKNIGSFIKIPRRAPTFTSQVVPYSLMVHFKIMKHSFVVHQFVKQMVINPMVASQNRTNQRAEIKNEQFHLIRSEQTAERNRFGLCLSRLITYLVGSQNSKVFCYNEFLFLRICSESG